MDQNFSSSDMGILYFPSLILKLSDLSSEGKVHSSHSESSMLSLTLIMFFHSFFLPNEISLSFQNDIQGPLRFRLFLNQTMVLSLISPFHLLWLVRLVNMLLSEHALHILISPVLVLSPLSLQASSFPFYHISRYVSLKVQHISLLFCVFPSLILPTMPPQSLGPFLGIVLTAYLVLLLNTSFFYQTKNF